MNINNDLECEYDNFIKKIDLKILELKKDFASLSNENKKRFMKYVKNNLPLYILNIEESLKKEGI